MGVRIDSDGTAKGTRVLTDAGEEMKGVKFIEWQAGLGIDPVAIVEIIGMPAFIKSVGQLFVCDPVTGRPREVKRIEWADGPDVWEK